jgi:hypothetical protein
MLAQAHGMQSASRVSRQNAARGQSLAAAPADQDSDVLWRISPPARRALEAVLEEPSAALTLSWQITRTAPLQVGGPAQTRKA